MAKSSEAQGVASDFRANSPWSRPLKLVLRAA
jgi:hypothetical protein